MCFETSKIFTKQHIFGFWYQTETFNYYEKWNSWGQGKCPAPLLSLNFPLNLNLILKSVKLILKMRVADDNIVMTTLNETDILIGQVNFTVELLLGLKEGWPQGLASGNGFSVQK